MKALWAALLVCGGCVHVTPLPAIAQVQRTVTVDGWGLELVHYPSEGSVTGRPVLLCHGISANGRNMDLSDGRSLARFLASRGRPVWVLSLRGTGGSERRGGITTFDDFWRSDLPAAIGHVRQASSATEVDFVGHSMGGLVAYAYLSQGGPGLHAVVTLGTPTNLAWGSGLNGLVSLAGGLISPKGSLPSGAGGLLAPFDGHRPDGWVERLFYQRSNTPPAAWRQLLTYGTADTAGGVLRQLLPIVDGGRFLSADRQIDFRSDMARITVPVLVVAGRLDRLAPAPAVRDGYDALGGPKGWKVVSRANGDQGDYGHMDLVLGDFAANDVWAPALAFLDGQ